MQTCERLHRQKKLPHPLCPHCNLQVPETWQHVVCDCPAWEPERNQAAFDHSAIAGLPAGTPLCGIAIHTPLFWEWNRERSNIQAIPRPVGQSLTALEHLDEEARVQIWTDGSSVPAAEGLIYSGGCGAFWSFGHPNNFGVPLPGGSQTSDRAELYAVLLCIQAETRPLTIVCDNKYVVDTLNTLLQGGQISGAHADLWAAIKDIVDQDVNRIRIRKTKGHATARDIMFGASTEIDRKHNEMADLLAEHGASLNTPPREVIESINGNRALVGKIQRQLLLIYKAREAKGAVVEEEVQKYAIVKAGLRENARRLMNLKANRQN